MNNYFVSDFIIIFLIFFFATYTKKFIQFSNTILGKLLVVLIILYYGSIDYIYGLFVCLGFVLYYQSFLFEGYESMDISGTDISGIDVSGTDDSYGGETDSSLNNIMKNMYDKIKEKTKDSSYNDVSYNSIDAFSNIRDISYVEHPLSNGQSNTYIPNVDMNDYDNHEYYQERDNHDDNDRTNENFINGRNYKKEFISKNCKNTELMYKNFEVKKDMTEFVFPEVKFNNKICNVCDPNCDFSIIENKLQTEELVLTPQNSNDWILDSYKKIKGVFNNPTPYLSDFIGFSQK
jgi:hypothetical protein